MTGSVTLHTHEDESLSLTAKLYRQSLPEPQGLLIIALATQADLPALETAVKRLQKEAQVSLKIFRTDNFTLASSLYSLVTHLKHLEKRTVAIFHFDTDG